MDDSNKTVRTLSIFAALIAIFVFVTGWKNLPQIMLTVSQVFNPARNEGNDKPVDDSQSYEFPPAIEPTQTVILGGTWKQLGLVEDIISDLEIDSNGNLYAATLGYNHGVFASIDGGLSWKAINQNLGNRYIYDLEIINNSSALIAATEEGLWVSNATSINWQKLDLGELANRRFFSVAANDFIGHIIAFSDYGNDIVYSYDRGSIWQVGKDVANVYQYGIMATSNTENKTFYLAEKNHIYRSDDSGVNWSRLSDIGADNDISDFEVNKFSPNIAYVCTGYRDYFQTKLKFWEGNGIYKTEDFGNIWYAQNNGIKNQGTDTKCTAISIDYDNNFIFVAVDNQIYQTINYGSSWVQVSELPDNISDVTDILVNQMSDSICISTNGMGFWCLEQ